MSNDGFILGVRRRKIEDAITANFDKVNFRQKQYRWLEDQVFWDYVFSWYDLAKYYEDVPDTALGAHMLDLYAHCVTLFRTAAADRNIPERRRDKAADALYQINYYVNQMMLAVQNNANQSDDSAGTIQWKSS